MKFLLLKLFLINCSLPSEVGYRIHPLHFELFKGKIHFFPKVLKKWSSCQKNGYHSFFGRGVRTQSDENHFFFEPLQMYPTLWYFFKNCNHTWSYIFLNKIILGGSWHLLCETKPSFGSCWGKKIWRRGNLDQSQGQDFICQQHWFIHHILKWCCQEGLVLLQSMSSKCGNIRGNQKMCLQKTC